MKLNPLGNRLVVEKISHQISQSIIFAPGIAEENYGGPKLFRVIATGPGRLNKDGTRIPIQCAIGDRVLCASYFTGPAELGDGRFCITENEILAVLPHP